MAIADVSEERISLRELSLAGDLAAIEAVVQSQHSPLTIAIDAPTIVPNTVGMRPMERELQRRFGAASAGPYPANRTLLGRVNGGRPRGEELVEFLRDRLGVREVGVPPARHRGTYVMEVFPAPAIVMLFGLSSSLRYKKKPQRTWGTCRAELNRYIDLLRSLRSPTLVFPKSIAVAEERGKAFKALEDRVDAILCAYLAGLGWLFGHERLEMVGSLNEGYIVLPRPS
jgi:predicted RNase H-like nuclease